MTDPFVTARAAARALLSDDFGLSRRAGAFAGQLIVDPTPLTVAQRKWLDALLSRAGLPPLIGDDA